MHNASDYGYCTTARCIACGKTDIFCCDGHGGPMTGIKITKREIWKMGEAALLELSDSDHPMAAEAERELNCREMDRHQSETMGIARDDTPSVTPWWANR